MLSDFISERKSPKKRSVSDVRARYSDSQKLEAVKLWLITGNLTITAATLNINFLTIRDWRYSKWWEDTVRELKQGSRIELSNKLRTIVDKSLGLVQDRIDNGDFFYDQKTGQMIRKPIPAREVNKIATDMLDRMQQLEKADVQEEDQQHTQDRLAKLADAFEKLAKKKNIIEVTDVIFGEEDAFSKEREAGLQEGSSVGEDSGDLSTEGSCGENAEQT